jgi:hypothetical protein
MEEDLINVCVCYATLMLDAKMFLRMWMFYADAANTVNVFVNLQNSVLCLIMCIFLTNV